MTDLRHINISSKTLILTDLDGTFLKLRSDPSMRRMDGRGLAALKWFNKYCPDQVVAVTARDYEQVKQCFYNKKPKIPVITSNGAEIQFPDGREFSYNFSVEEQRFYDHMRYRMQLFKQENPWMVVEVKRREVGYHSLPTTEFFMREKNKDELMDKVRTSAENALSLLTELHEKALSQNLNFVMAGAEQTNHAIFHGGIDKVDSMGWFGQHLASLPQSKDWSHVIYCGDGLVSGNDRKIAKLVRQRGGVVVQVTNGVHANIPPEGDNAEPHFAVESPAELGAFFFDRVKKFVSRTRQARMNIR